MSRILALDVGDKRIGVAISDELLMFGRPFGVVKNDKNAYAEIARICQQNQVLEIVAGLPITMKGQVGEQAKKTKEFVKNLGKIVNIPVILQDERLTTVMVEKMLILEGVKTSRRKELLDQMAAKVILQEYLDSKRK